MKKELEDKLIAGLDKISNWVNSAETLTKEHMPDIAKEILAVERLQAWVNLIACSLFLLVFCVGTAISWFTYSSGFATFINGVVALFVLTSEFCAIYDTIRTYISPKLIILKELRGLMP